MKTQITRQNTNTPQGQSIAAGMMPIRRALLLLLLCSAIALTVSGTAAFGQDQNTPLTGYFKTIPLQGKTPDQVQQESAAGNTVPMWTYLVDSPVDKATFSGQIVGNPVGQNRTTYIPTYVVPLIVKINGITFDPTLADPTCANNNVPLTLVQQSPLFQNSGPFLWGSPPQNFGSTQYVDAFLRGQFSWGTSLFVNWHNLFALNTSNAVTVTVPSGLGGVYSAPCGNLGIVDNGWLDNYVRNTLIPSLANQGVGSTTFPIVLMYNVVQSAGSVCCILGYHGAYGTPNTQIYAVSLFDTSQAFGNASQDISALSHELAEAMNDPTGLNPTPAWGHIGQVSGCQSNFEVGDPLSGTIYKNGGNVGIALNGYTYHPQELAFFDWFFRYQPNMGPPGWYSNSGTFLTDAGPVCS